MALASGLARRARIKTRAQAGQEHGYHQQLQPQRAHGRGAPLLDAAERPARDPTAAALQHVTHTATADAAHVAATAPAIAVSYTKTWAEPWVQSWRRAFPRALRGRRRAAEVATRALLAASVLPALVLAVQPLLHSSPGVAVAAASVSPGAWQGPLRDMFSFTVLLSVFINCEPGAAVASAVSATGAAILMVTQGAMSFEARCTATLLAAAASVVLFVSGLAAVDGGKQGQREPQQPKQQEPHRWWHPDQTIPAVQRALGVLGGGLLVQFLTSLLPGRTSAAWLPPVAVGAAAALLAGAFVDRSGDTRLRLLWDDWPAWSATLLLILQPLQQMFETSLSPAALLPAIPVRDQLLLVFASGLMVPRALLMAELMWFTGTCSGALLAAGQLVVMGAAAAAQQLLAAGGVPAATAAGCDTVVAAAAVAGLVAALGMALCVLRAGWRSILSRRPYPDTGSASAAATVPTAAAAQ